MEGQDLMKKEVAREYDQVCHETIEAEEFKKQLAPHDVRTVNYLRQIHRGVEPITSERLE